MTYMAVYGGISSKSVGKLYRSKDLLFQNGYAAIKDYYMGQDNQTAEIFGTDLEIENQKQGDKIYDFFIYKVKGKRLKVVDHVNMKYYLELEKRTLRTQEGIDKIVLAYINSVIIDKLEELQEHEYFYDLVSCIFLIDSVDSIKEAELYIVNAYIDLIKIAHFRNYKSTVLEYEAVSSFDLQQLMSSLAIALESDLEVGPIIRTLILYLWHMAENKHETEFVKLLRTCVGKSAGLKYY
ncbi:hypothetical protein HZY88_01245 [Aerococcaceae bacterium DSM 111176]|nr:hypothetical protein [Aerococcaceae bacterium DSM 111176]